MQGAVGHGECSDALGWSEQLIDLDDLLDEERVRGGGEGERDGAAGESYSAFCPRNFLKRKAYTECQVDLSAGGCGGISCGEGAGEGRAELERKSASWVSFLPSPRPRIVDGRMSKPRTRTALAAKDSQNALPGALLQSSLDPSVNTLN